MMLRELRSEMAAKLQPVLDAALQGLNSTKTQILFEKVVYVVRVHGGGTEDHMHPKKI